ncbi:MAG TPA: ABC-2 family transporter protein [Chloroflexota bacterium]|nr:ABC-2 family transporter protein [Chloroflexota bacterium]
MATICAIWRQWRLFAWLDFTWITRNLSFFLTYFISDVTRGLSTVAATFLLAERFDGIGPWTTPQILFMLGYATLVRGTEDVFFGYNVAVISRRIGRGQLDHTLVQPRPIWVTLLTEGFTPFSGSTVLLPGVGLLVWAASRLSLPVSPGWLALALVNFAASCAIVLAFSFLWGSLAFWAQRAAEEISSSAMNVMQQLTPFPLDGLGAGWLGGMLTIVPAGFVAWYPCRALLGIDPSPYAVGVTPLAAIAITLLTIGVFQKGMKHYGRVGSQRYLSFGHRR